MLEGLEQLDWQGLGEGAELIPFLLWSLSDAQRRDHDVEELGELELLVCPGRARLTDASAHVLPFLLRLGAEPDVPRRDAILELVQCLARLAGAPSSDAVQVLHQRSTLSSLQIHDQRLLHLLSDDSAQVRARAALIAGELGVLDAVRGSELIARLTALLDWEPTPSTRVAHVTALERLGATGVIRRTLEDSSPAVRLASALALLAVDEPSSPAYELVRAALAQPKHSERAYGEAARYRPLDWIARICAAGQRAASALLPSLLPLLARSSAHRAEVDLEPLLALFVPRGGAAEPTPELSAILATTAQNHQYFASSLGNPELVLQKYGLPARARPLRQYAGRGPSSHLRWVPHDHADKSAQRVLAHIERDELAGRNARELHALSIVGTGSDELLSLLTRFSGLEQLSLKSSPLTAQGLRNLAELPALYALVLDDLTLDGPGARELARLPRLAYLTLADVTLDDATLAELARATRLTYLSMLGCPASGLGLRAFAGTQLRTLALKDHMTLVPAAFDALPELRELNTLRLDTLQIGESWLSVLRGCEKLEELGLLGLFLRDYLPVPPALSALKLARSLISPRVLESLIDCPRLLQLDLSEVPLSRTHFEVLSSCRSLRVLRASHALVNPVDTLLLARARPDLHVQLV